MTPATRLLAALREAIARMRGTLRRARRDDDLQAELQLHKDLAAEAERRRGVAPDLAVRSAVLRAGGTAQAMDAMRDQRGWPWLEDFPRDVRFAVRALRKQPGFTTVAVLTLALGIGANAATFSVVHSVLLQPLPYRHSTRLVRVAENVPGPEIGDGKGPARRYDAMDVADVLSVPNRSQTISQTASFALTRPVAIVDASAIRMEGFLVSAGFFDTLGVPPLVGRVFTPEETSTRAGVLVLQYQTWRTRFGGDPNVLGRVISFGAEGDFTVIGVMPPTFRFPHDGAQFWIPLHLAVPAGGRSPRYSTVARLADGATPAAAAAELETIQRARRGSAAASTTAPRFELTPLQDELTGPVKPALLVLSAAVWVVLLIACVNMANLLLARSESRQREMAVRAAIGAGRGRLVRQMLTESLVLSAIGGATGIGLAYLGVRLFRALGTTLGRADLGLTTVFPRLGEVAIDATVLGYALLLSIGTGVAFGLVPAIRSPGSDQRNFLRDVRATPQTGLKHALIVAETALALLLLIGGGLLIHSFVKLATVDVGFDASNLLTFQVTTTGTARPAEQRAFAETLVERLRPLPGVAGAAYGRQLPLVQLGDTITLTTLRNGVETRLGTGADVRFVSREYLKTLGARIVSGRGFAETDGEGRPAVVIINEALAQRDFAGVNPLGQIVFFGAQRQMPLEIIGIVGNIRQRGLDRPATPQYFIDYRQVPIDPAIRTPPLFPLGPYYTVRTSADPAALVGNIRSLVRQMDPQATLYHVATMEEILSNSITRPWMYAVLLGIFAGVALSLAAIGLYGVMAYTVTQRTREIGIRMALGADRRRVLRLVLRQSAVLTALGLVIGLAGSFVATRFLTDLLFGLTPLDPRTYVMASAIFALVAAVASYVPARRATAVDPMMALRND